MKLLSIEFKDFMQFEHRVFDLSKPLNVICGRNGSGKSSILEGIALSFQIKERNSSVGSYIRRVPEGQPAPKKAKVILKAEYLGEELTISSEFAETGRKITRLVTYKDETFENMKGNKFLSNFFTLSKMNLAFSLQGNDRYITDSPTVNLKNLIDLFGVCFDDKLEQLKIINREATTNLNTSIAKCSERAGGISTLEGLYTSLLNSIKQTEEFLNTHELTDVQDLQSRLDSLKGELTLVNAAREEYKKSMQSYLQWKDSVKNCTLNLEGSTQNRKAITLSKPDPFEEHEATLNTIIQDLEEAMTSISSIKVKQSSTDVKLDECVKKFNLIKAGKCPICESPISSEKLDRDTQEIEKLKKEKEDLVIALQQAQETAAALKAAEVETRELVGKLKNDAIVYQNNIRLVEEYDRNIAFYSSQLDTLKANPVVEPEYFDDVQLNALETSIRETQQEINGILSENNNITFNHRKLEESKQTLSGYESKLSQEQEESAKLTEEKAYWESKIDVVADSSTILGAIPKLFLNTIVIPIQAAARSYASKFGYEFRLDTTDGLEFELGKPIADGILYIPYRSQSSFEKILTNVVFIMAIQTYLGLPFLCLDEVDNSADPYNTKVFKGLMSELSEKLQVILITHEAESLNEYIQDDKVSFVNLSN